RSSRRTRGVSRAARAPPWRHPPVRGGPGRDLLPAWNGPGQERVETRLVSWQYIGPYRRRVRGRVWSDHRSTQSRFFLRQWREPPHLEKYSSSLASRAILPLRRI